MNPLWLTYASACLALHGVRVDASWSAEEITAAWCTLPRPGVDFQHWLLAMRAMAQPEASQKDDPDEFIGRWNSKSDELNPPQQSAGPVAGRVEEPAEWKTLDPITLKNEPDVRAVFDSWADAQRENAYVLVASPSGYQRRLVLNSQIGGA